MRESNFYQDIYSFLKLYRKKRALKFLFPVLLGVLYKLNSIALFIIPIQAIKSVSEKKFSSIIKSIFEFFNFKAPPDQHTYIFFLILIIFSLLMLIYINKLKNFYILDLKKEFNSTKNIINKFESKIARSNTKQKNKRIENFVKNSENIFFCLILFIFIFFYDYQISLILIFGSILYIIMTNIINTDRLKLNSKRKQTNKTHHENSFIFFKNLKIDSKILKPITSTVIMILIMTLLYLRNNSTTSIIFIFLIRIFQNNMLNSLKEFFKRNELPF